MTSKPRKKTVVAQFPGTRPLTDAREIRAIAHPVRIALLEALSREGPLTATQASEILDESPANCSFHLRILAKYGFIEEVPGSAGRARPWRRITLGQTLDVLPDESEASVAAQALLQLEQVRIFDRARQFAANVAAFPQEWQDAAYLASWLVYVTPEELNEISEGVVEQLSKFRARTADRSLRPDGSRAVQLTAFGFPLPPTPSGN